MKIHERLITVKPDRHAESCDHISLDTAITQARINHLSPAANGRGTVTVTNLTPGTRVDITLPV